MSRITTVCCLAVLVLLTFSRMACFAQSSGTPTYTVGISGGSFSPNPAFVPNSATAMLNASLNPSYSNSEYQEGGDQWSWTAQLGSYTSTKGGSAQVASNPPSVSCSSGSNASTITVGTTQATTTGYYVIVIQVTDSFNVTYNGTTTAMSSTGLTSLPITVASLTVTVTNLDTKSSTMFLVGQEATALANVSPADLVPSPVPAGFFSWKIDGTTEENFTASTDSGSVTPTSAFVDQGVEFYWSDAGQKSLTVSVLGQSKTTQVAVTSPSASMSAVMMATVVDTNYIGSTGYSLHLGTGTNGIIWTYTVDNSVGSYEMIQLDTASGSETTQNNSTDTEKWSSGVTGKFPAIDTKYPYRSNNIKSGETDCDSPSVALTNSLKSLTESDSFIDYLMFMPSGTFSNWVPIGTMSWSYGGTANNPTNAAGGYTNSWVGTGLTPDKTGTKPVFKAGTTYPSWTDNVMNFGYVGQ